MIAAAINAITRASGTAQMRDRLFLLQMPVMFAGRINHIGLYDVSNYATTNIHTGTSLIGMDLME